MPEIRDVELLKTTDEQLPGDAPPGRRTAWLAVAALVVIIAVAAYFVFGRRAPRPVAQATKPVQVTQQSVKPLGGEADSIVLPPLDETDAVVRELVAKLSSHPAVAAWLTTEGLVRNFTVVVANVVEGRTPAVHLRTVRPATKFQVIERGGEIYIDPRGYHRYDHVAAAAASIDPAGAARLYSTLKPRIEDAYRELGAPDGTFDRALERAIVVLLKTPVVDGPIRLENHGAVGYAFAAPELEALSPPQKLLLRAGPANVRAVKSALRAIAIALGIPAERLPADGS
jgi:hypothetical protein